MDSMQLQKGMLKACPLLLYNFTLNKNFFNVYCCCCSFTDSTSICCPQSKASTTVTSSGSIPSLSVHFNSADGTLDDIPFMQHSTNTSEQTTSAIAVNPDTELRSNCGKFMSSMVSDTGFMKNEESRLSTIHAVTPVRS